MSLLFSSPPDYYWSVSSIFSFFCFCVVLSFPFEHRGAVQSKIISPLHTFFKTPPPNKKLTWAECQTTWKSLITWSVWIRGHLPAILQPQMVSVALTAHSRLTDITSVSSVIQHVKLQLLLFFHCWKVSKNNIHKCLQKKSNDWFEGQEVTYSTNKFSSCTDL